MISVIIPCHNEERIHDVVDGVEKILDGNFKEGDHEILIASDRDGRGKGWAVRQAMEFARGNIIIFLDGDMDINPRMILRLLPHLTEFDIVVGKKNTRKIFSRWILTILSRIYIRMMFGIQVDTQTGIKAFWKYALPDWKTNGFAFDIEILSKAKKIGFSMYEVTVEASASKKMKLRSIIMCLIESLKIKFL